MNTEKQSQHFHVPKCSRTEHEDLWKRVKRKNPIWTESGKWLISGQENVKSRWMLFSCFQIKEAFWIKLQEWNICRTSSKLLGPPTWRLIPPLPLACGRRPLASSCQACRPRPSLQSVTHRAPPGTLLRAGAVVRGLQGRAEGALERESWHAMGGGKSGALGYYLGLKGVQACPPLWSC